MKKKQNGALIKRFSPDLNSGLNDLQVRQRIEERQVNSVKKKYSKSYLSIFIGNIFTFFNLLGLIVTVALIVAKAGITSFFFDLIYLANIFIGIILEIRAKRCIDKLSLISEKKVDVIRNGETLSVSSDQIVLDDVVLLNLGDQIPVDGILLDGTIDVNESLLTGESVSVTKKIGDKLYAGSFISSGKCKILADKVGKEKYIETLSETAKKYKKPSSEIMSSLKKIIKVISFIIIPIATASMLKSTLISQNDLFSAIKGTSTLVIGMIPSGMFLLTSMALAVGVIKLYKKKTLVQDLYSLEMLARVDTICFDKTGTITDGKMTVKEFLPLNEKNRDELFKITGAILGTLNDTNQTAIALSNFFGKNADGFIVKSSLPFNSERKFSAVTFENFGTYAFGAPEFLLKGENLKKVEQKVSDLAKEGLRVLVLAHSKNDIKDGKIERSFEPVALITISDNIREDAFETVKWFKENGVAIKVISGDNPITVSEVSKRVGIDNADKYINLEGLSEKEVELAANEYTVFGRVSPEQKAIIIRAIKKAGHVTAMTGDGVNDILALKEADCAVSVAAGSDAAKNISHLVLMDNNFNSMPQIVFEGRRVINNVKSSASLYLMKTLFTMLVAILSLALPIYKAYPFNLPHMIMLEVFVIGLPSFFLSLQPNDSRVEGAFIPYILKKSLPSAVLMVLSVAVFLITKYSFGYFENNPQYSDALYTTLTVYSFTFAGIVSLLNICQPLNKYRAVLFFSNLFVVTFIIAFGMINGFSSFGLIKLLSFSEMWHHYLILFGLMILDIPLLYVLDKFFTKITSLKIKRK